DGIVIGRTVAHPCAASRCRKRAHALGAQREKYGIELVSDTRRPVLLVIHALPRNIKVCIVFCRYFCVMTVLISVRHAIEIAVIRFWRANNLLRVYHSGCQVSRSLRLSARAHTTRTRNFILMNDPSRRETLTVYFLAWSLSYLSLSDSDPRFWDWWI